jgi:GNAT superfamily N-acetyltransferase
MGRVHTLAWQGGYRGLIPVHYLDSLDAAAAAERWRTSLTRPEDNVNPSAQLAVLVIEGDGGQVVGISSVGPARDESLGGELWMINLLPAVWGQGYGRTLLEEATAELRRAGYADAVLWVLEANSRARRFYAAAGWQADGSEKADESRGFPMQEVRYRRSL